MLEMYILENEVESQSISNTRVGGFKRVSKRTNITRGKLRFIAGSRSRKTNYDRLTTNFFDLSNNVTDDFTDFSEKGMEEYKEQLIKNRKNSKIVSKISEEMLDEKRVFRVNIDE